MKKFLFLLIFLIPIAAFSQYTGNKLPSGLTVSTTVDSADYTIIQKNGENIVKAVRMDTLKTFFNDAILDGIVSMDSVTGTAGQFIISDGVGWLAPSSAKYLGNDAYDFGYRAGSVGYGSIVFQGLPTIAYKNTASSTNAMVWGRSNEVTGNAGTCWGNNNSVKGQYGTAWGQQSYVGSLGGTAWNRGYVTGVSGTSFGDSTISASLLETSFGRFNDTITGGNATSWIATDQLFTIGNGTSGASRNNALTMLKNGNTTATGDWTITGDLEVTGNINTPAGARIGAYVPEDSTLSQTVAANVWEFVGDGDNNKFVNIYTNQFAFTGDTLQFVGTDSIYAHCEWGGTVSSDAVTTDVCVTIYINDVLQPQLQTSTRTGTAGELYPLAGCSNIVLLPPDATIKIYVRANKNCTLTFQCFPVSLHKIQ